MEPDSMQKEEENKLADWVKNRVEESRKSASRISSEGIWMTNAAYIMGYQVFWDTATKQFLNNDRGVKSFRRNRMQVNKILPRAQNRLSRLTKSRPKFIVRPESSDIEDKDAARLAEHILTMSWEKFEIDLKYIESVSSMQQCGHSYLKVCWDTSLGDPVIDPDTQKTDYEGDVRVDVVSAFEVFPDPLAKTLRDAAYLTQAKVRKLDYFRIQYPEKGHLVKEESAWLLSAQYENKINTMNTTTSGNMGSQEMKNCAIELTYYERRSKKHPNGRMIVVANGVLLKDEELPIGEIPFIKLDDVLVNGKYYSDSVITHARPVQDQINRIMNKRAEWTNRLLAGKYIAPRGAGLEDEGMNDQSAEVVYYNPVPNGSVPQAMSIPVMPAYAYTEEETLERMLDDIFGVNEISRGVLPAAGIPAIGMAFLSEQDDTRIGVVSRRLEKGIAQLMRMILLYIQKYYVNERKLKIAGQNKEYQVKYFSGADIKNNTDVYVIEGSSLPGSVTAKREQIKEYYSMGLFGNPQDPKVIERVLQLLEFGDVGEMWNDMGVDSTQILKGIAMIEEEIPPIIDEFDNHELWFKELNKYRKSDKFEKMSDISKMILRQTMEKCVKNIMNFANPSLPPDMLPHPELEQQLNEPLPQEGEPNGIAI